MSNIALYPDNTGICEGSCETHLPLGKLHIINDTHHPWWGYSLVCTQCMQTDRQFIAIKDGITGLQALARGAMTRNRVLPAMLSADPTDLHQAVQYCENKCPTCRKKLKY